MKDKSVLPLPLYRASQVRELDRVAIEEMGIPGICLMERAGSTAFQVMQSCYPKLKRIIVLCGTGNNGGDGYVIARLAFLAGYDVTVLQLGNTNQLKGEARLAFEAMLSVGLSPQVFSEKKLAIVDLIVDALLGTGLDREVAGKFRDVIEAVGRRTCPVLSLDIPSGLHADTGKVMGAAIKADITVSFIGLKQGLFTGDGPEYCGKIYFDDLQVPEAIYKQVRHTVSRLPDALCREAFARRPRNAHKGSFGHVLIIGGEQGMSGAARLAAEAAGRVGAGKVSIATRASHADVLNLTRPEIMCHGIETAKELAPLIANADVIAIGTGLGQGAWGKAMLEAIRHVEKPIVIDADALNLLAQSPFRLTNSVITPHAGEAARLLHLSVDEVEADRFAAVQALQLRFGGLCILKGAGTLIADTQGQIAICTAGNPGMATGGMGDVLTGVIVGLLAQGFNPLQASYLGVCLHGKAGDKAALEGERGLLPSDLFPWLRYFVNPELHTEEKLAP
ncbi:yjeF-like protein, hydroxyethylthiazole kinase-related [Beggiatoa alba B18LD]|uniref:Bifunctional NAD(P)H-hydrate repair enzyme n=1 Tax=Beggiatoa alba B18LD TaxID=395493 RepID=I3CBQ8_9GAMM|nr:NAD(P)H-hydrate dehydratase [Beggiatoa alba]EIJ41051.1 yjeF-like protein, hydroxyethylthiazole kinase-related [Beggiatoa alba B18LD]